MTIVPLENDNRFGSRRHQYIPQLSYSERRTPSPPRLPSTLPHQCACPERRRSASHPNRTVGDVGATPPAPIIQSATSAPCLPPQLQQLATALAPWQPAVAARGALPWSAPASVRCRGGSVPCPASASPPGSAPRRPTVAALGAPPVSMPLLRAPLVHAQSSLGEHAGAPLPVLRTAPPSLPCSSSTQRYRASAARCGSGDRRGKNKEGTKDLR